MKKTFHNMVELVLLSFLIAGMFSSQVYAGWIHTTDDRWWYATNEIQTSWYSAGPSGVIWQWIDGNQDGIAECYAFNSEGWMYANTITPDGYVVNADGAWIVQGIVQTQYSKLSDMSESGGYSSRREYGGKSEKIEQEEQSEIVWTYTVRLVEDGSNMVLKEIQGKAPQNTQLQFGYLLEGYTLKPGQDLSPTLTENGKIFTVYFTKNQTDNSEISLDEEELCSYRIQYVDIDSKDILGVFTGSAKKKSIVSIELPDIDGYEAISSQELEFPLLENGMVQKVYYEGNIEATPSNAQEVKWEVQFTDEGHSRKLWPTQSGKICDGGELTINFPEILHKDGKIWESIVSPPLVQTVYGPGTYLEYIEYIEQGEIPEEPDISAQARERLQSYLQEAKDYDSQITGETSGTIPDSRFIVASQAENDKRAISIASQVKDENIHTFLVIGQDFVPNGKAIAEWLGEKAVYSNLLEDVLIIDDTTYYIARMSIQRKVDEIGIHNWIVKNLTSPTCLGKGKTIYTCTITGDEREVFTAPLGHRDADGDSICDNCKKRAIPQQAGSKIQASLASQVLSFTCIDDNYSDTGGMLYLSDQTIPLEFFGEYGSSVYGDSQIEKYFRNGFQNDFSISNLMGIKLPETKGIGYAMSLSRDEYDAYQTQISSDAPFFLRDNIDEQVWGVTQNGNCELIETDSAGYGIRPAILLEKPDEGIRERIHWDIGDIQVQEIDGNNYMFRCIDQNYADETENHNQTALFLCETVIPANYDSNYVLEKQPDGSHRYVFKAGPIVNFGDSNDYKYSRIHQWLEQFGGLSGMESIQVGVDYAFTGKTLEGMYSDFNSNTLKSHYIGDQHLQSCLFILSVDEAMKYKENLWKFEGADEENPETQISAFSKGFWLRNPMGNSDISDTDYVYIVDLVNGNIHPFLIQPEKVGNDELDITTTIGIRPAFVMPQDR